MKAKIIKLPRIDDDRGSLSFVQAGNEIPFPIVRAVWIYDVPNMMTRGGHAHRWQDQLIIAVHGQISVTVEDKESMQTFHLIKPDRGLHIPMMNWCEVDEFSSDAVCLMLASKGYIESNYIRNYQEFQDAIA